MTSPTRTSRSGRSTMDFVEEDDMSFRSHPKFQTQSATFRSKSSRFPEHKVFGPSPTSYNPSIDSKKGGVILGSKEPRIAAHRDSNAPPPNTYNIQPSWSAPNVAGAVFKSRSPRNRTTSNGTPGPDVYSEDQSQTHLSPSNNVALSAFRSRSPRLLKQDGTSGPPPTAYSAPTKSETSPTPANAVFHSKSPRIVEHKVPDYSPAPSSDVMASFDKTCSSPGYATSSFSSTSPRLKIRTTDTPAPGHYDPVPVSTIPGKNASSASFKSQSPRIVTGNAPVGPTPTSYNPVSDFSARVRSYTAPSSAFHSTTARFKDRDGNFQNYASIPGFVDDLKGKPGCSAAFRSQVPRVQRHGNDVPGPGYYSGGTSGSSSRSMTAVFKSRVGRNTATGTFGPGPGSYDAKTSLTTKGTTVFRSSVPRMKQPKPVTKGPDPGAHNIPSTVGELRRGCAFTKLTEPRFKARPDDNPGPGAFIKKYSSFLE